MASKAADQIKVDPKGASSKADDDFIISGDGNDNLTGGGGNDQISGGGGNDKINAGGGNDTVDGGTGDDFLNGAGGSDVYRFHFAVSGGATESHTFVYVPSEAFPNNGDFAIQYTDFLVSVFGSATNFLWRQTIAEDPLLSFVTEVTAEDSTVESVQVPSGRGFGTLFYEDTITTSGPGGPAAITASDGHDTIAQFQNAGPNVDTIELHGLAGMSDADLSALFDLTTIDTNGDSVADSTLLSWDGGSIKILGSTNWADELAFFHDPHVMLL
jgi:Ca2+-binding RTX toxin-like protein